MWDGVHVHHASRLTPKGCVLGGWVCHGKINDFLSDFRGGETRRPPPLLPAASPRPPPHKETTQINRGLFWSALCFLQPSAFQSLCQWPFKSQHLLEHRLRLRVWVVSFKEVKNVIWLLWRWWGSNVQRWYRTTRRVLYIQILRSPFFRLLLSAQTSGGISFVWFEITVSVATT